MKFDAKKFMGTKFEQRTREIAVKDKDLIQFFDLKKGEKAKWVVRSLTAEECARANDSKRMTRYLAEIASRLAVALKAEGAANKVGENFVDLFGIGKGEELPDDYSYRLTLFELGTVEPKIDKRFAVTMAVRKPEFFYRVTNEIIALIGEGQTLGESKPSGTTRK